MNPPIIQVNPGEMRVPASARIKTISSAMVPEKQRGNLPPLSASARRSTERPSTEGRVIRPTRFSPNTVLSVEGPLWKPLLQSSGLLHSTYVVQPTPSGLYPQPPMTAATDLSPRAPAAPRPTTQHNRRWGRRRSKTQDQVPIIAEDARTFAVRRRRTRSLELAGMKLDPQLADGPRWAIIE